MLVTEYHVHFKFLKNLETERKEKSRTILVIESHAHFNCGNSLKKRKKRPSEAVNKFCIPPGKLDRSILEQKLMKFVPYVI